jgi:hypothetical protein
MDQIPGSRGGAQPLTQPNGIRDIEALTSVVDKICLHFPQRGPRESQNFCHIVGDSPRREHGSARMSFSASTSAFLKATLSMVGFTAAPRTNPAGMRLIASPSMAGRPFPPSDSIQAPSGESRSHELVRPVFGRRPPQQAALLFDRDPHLRLTRDGIWEVLAEQDQENAA